MIVKTSIGDITISERFRRQAEEGSVYAITLYYNKKRFTFDFIIGNYYSTLFDSSLTDYQILLAFHTILDDAVNTQHGYDGFCEIFGFDCELPESKILFKKSQSNKFNKLNDLFGCDLFNLFTEIHKELCSKNFILN